MDEKAQKFQKRLAGLQIEASAVSTLAAILIALGFTVLLTLQSSNLYPFDGILLATVGIVILLLTLFSIKKKINELQY